MTKFEFIKELEELLSDIPADERNEALQYYGNYFEDAGPEREQDIISELGSPQKAAASIKADLNANEQELNSRGYFTEKGYEDHTFREPKYEIIDGMATEKNTDQEENADTSDGWNTGQYYSDSQNSGNRQYTNSQNSADGSRENKNYDYRSENKNYDYRSENNRYEQANNTNSGLKTVLIVLLCIFAIPVGIPLVATVFGLFVAAIAVVASIWLAFVIISAVFILTGIAVIIVGFIKLVTVPALGICFAGGGLILFGVGLLFTMATIALSTKVLPVLFRGFINFCRLPFQNRRAAA